jgi:Na+/H+ antiporter NhaC
MLTGVSGYGRKEGGINYLLPKKKRIRNKKSAQVGIEHWWVLQIWLCNNTVSIVITGPIAKEINDEYV